MKTTFYKRFNQTTLQLNSPITLKEIESTFQKCGTNSVETLYCCGINITPGVWDLFYTLNSLKNLTLDHCRFAPEIHLSFSQLENLELQFVCDDFLNLLNLRISFPNMTEKLMFEDKPLLRLL
jgi:hypothetical protein